MKTFFALAAFTLGISGAAIAGEITVMSGGAIEPGLVAAARAFETETGHQVRITFNTTPQMVKRLPAINSTS